LAQYRGETYGRTIATLAIKFVWSGDTRVAAELQNVEQKVIDSADLSHFPAEARRSF
jgi:hypothetical protein